jgi:uncharacterized membrane protein
MRPVAWALLGGAALCLAVFIYDDILRVLLLPVLVPGVRWPRVPGGVQTMTLILWAFSLLHATYALGWRHSLTFLVLSTSIAWTFEQVGVATGLVFGPYHYTEALGLRVGLVPVLIPLAWFMMIYPSYVIANLLADGRPFGTRGGLGHLLWLAALSALVMTAWDLLIDPIMAGPGRAAWVWETGGPYFGIPLQNFVGWLLTTFTVYLGYRAFEWARPPRPIGPATVATAAMPLVAYGAMLLSNLLSTGPAALWVIGPFAMGVPLLLAASRLSK